MGLGGSTVNPISLSPISFSLAQFLPWLASTEIAVAPYRVRKRRMRDAGTRTHVSTCDGPTGRGIFRLSRQAFFGGRSVVHEAEQYRITKPRGAADVSKSSQARLRRDSRAAVRLSSQPSSRPGQGVMQPKDEFRTRINSASSSTVFRLVIRSMASFDLQRCKVRGVSERLCQWRL